jgi:DNA repair protein RadA/Sms
MVEVQALVAPTSYGVPQRSTTGFDPKRLQMLLAVLEKRVGLHLGQYDIFVNVVGGIKAVEPAVDLGMALSIVSSLRDRPVDHRMVAVGEVGLGGEIRAVTQMEKRLFEARNLGFTTCILPKRGVRGGNGDVQLLEVETVDEAIRAALPNN